ncbi:hypothetical protein BGZ74_002759 [Mortierella antarctica]|nr:hypothetical protein BGZ74_002759 [Mortierella antarctica]
MEGLATRPWNATEACHPTEPIKHHIWNNIAWQTSSCGSSSTLARPDPAAKAKENLAGTTAKGKASESTVNAITAQIRPSRSAYSNTTFSSVDGGISEPVQAHQLFFAFSIDRAAFNHTLTIGRSLTTHLAYSTFLCEPKWLRSTSDTKTSPFVATAVPQSSRTYNSGSKGFHQAGSPSYGSSQSPTSDSEDYSDENQTTLTASLHKIQALAHEQTGRMKQINYSEKKADLAEAVYEKSSQWRARGAEWGGIAKKAWEERGGMGGIAGGIADRWKRKADGTNEGGQDLSRSESSEPIFGLPLQDAVRISRISPSVGVPAVVTRCIEYLDIMGVEEVGLYRVPGSTSNVARLKTMFDHGLDYDFLQKGHEPQNPHDVATLLKLYLRELPAPIIPSETMPTFSNIDFTAPQQQFHKLKESLGLIPLENYILLGTLCRHLSNLADYESCTKMNISNLGLIFCPTLQIGSVLFKNLLGGDGDDEERARRLKIVWDDLDRKQEELENLEMIKEFEMGLLVVDSHPPNTSTTANNISNNNNHSNVGNSNDNGNNSAHSRTSRSQEWNRNEDRDRDRDDWEDVAQDVLIDFGSRPRSSDSTSRSSPPYNSLGNPYRATGHQREAGKMSVQPIPDLYDELMSKEINEATNTPLIDFRDDDDNTTGDQEKWRRHAREPAINKRDNHSGPRIGGHSRVTGHSRIPAGH